MNRLGGCLGRLLESLLKTGFPLIKIALKPLAKSALIPLRLTAKSAADQGNQKKIFWSGITISTISNKKVNDVMKIVKFLKDSSLRVSQKKNKVDFWTCY